MSYTFHSHLINCRLTSKASDCSAEDEGVLTCLPNAPSSIVSGKRACRSKNMQKKMQAQSLPSSPKTGCCWYDNYKVVRETCRKTELRPPKRTKANHEGVQPSKPKNAPHSRISPKSAYWFRDGVWVSDCQARIRSASAANEEIGIVEINWIVRPAITFLRPLHYQPASGTPLDYIAPHLPNRPYLLHYVHASNKSTYRHMKSYVWMRSHIVMAIILHFVIALLAHHWFGYEFPCLAEVRLKQSSWWQSYEHETAPPHRSTPTHGCCEEWGFVLVPWQSCQGIYNCSRAWINGIE